MEEIETVTSSDDPEVPTSEEAVEMQGIQTVQASRCL